MNKPILQELFGRPWAMDERQLCLFRDQVEKLSAGETLAGVDVVVTPKLVIDDEGTARIPIKGILLNTVPGWLRLWGLQATGYDEIGLMVAEAVANKRVKRILLDVDSPGGMVSGVTEASDAIYAARQVKSVRALVNDMAASGAYWLASQATAIVAATVNATAGSVGVYSVYYDWSKWEEDRGIKSVVIRSGPIKAMGVDAITDEQVEAVQEMIDGMAENFYKDIAQGRSMSLDEIRALGTGQLWIARDARAVGLIDGIEDLRRDVVPDQDQEQEQETTEALSATEQGDENMAPENDTSVESVSAESIRAEERQRLRQITEACDGDAEFAQNAWERGLTVTEAKSEYADVLKDKLATAEAERDAAVQASARTDTDADAEPLATGGSTGSGAGGDFMAQVRQRCREASVSKIQAMKEIARENPGLHEAHVKRQSQHGNRRFEHHGNERQARR
jgi:signal peptide peptidase SppA